MAARERDAGSDDQVQSTRDNAYALVKHYPNESWVKRKNTRWQVRTSLLTSAAYRRNHYVSALATGNLYDSVYTFTCGNIHRQNYYTLY